MKIINGLCKDNIFLKGFMMSLATVAAVITAFALMISLIVFIPLTIYNCTGWWSVILLPLYVGTIGGIIFILGEKLDF